MCEGEAQVKQTTLWVKWLFHRKTGQLYGRDPPVAANTMVAIARSSARRYQHAG
jgi:hypothetical protein